MNQKNEKKMRRERRKAIKQFIEDNEDMVLTEVIVTMQGGKLLERIAFSFMLIFKIPVKE